MVCLNISVIFYELDFFSNWEGNEAIKTCSLALSLVFPLVCQIKEYILLFKMAVNIKPVSLKYKQVSFILTKSVRSTCSRKTLVLKVWSSYLNVSASTSLGNLLEMQTLGLHPRPTESESLGLRFSNLF